MTAFKPFLAMIAAGLLSGVLFGGARVARAAEPEQIAKPESWRYVWHEGRWWYYQPGGHWLFWNGASWETLAAAQAKSAMLPNNAGVSVAEPFYPVFTQPGWFGRPARENHGWVGGFYSSGGGYGSSDFGYGYGVPSYGPWGN